MSSSEAPDGGGTPVAAGGSAFRWRRSGLKRTRVVRVTMSWVTDATRCRSRRPPAATSRESPTLTVPTRPVRRTRAPALNGIAAGGMVIRGAMAFHSARPVMGAIVSKVAGWFPGSGTDWAWVPVARAIEAGDPLGGLAGPAGALAGLPAPGSGGGLFIVKDSAVLAARPGRSLYPISLASSPTETSSVAVRR